MIRRGLIRSDLLPVPTDFRKSVVYLEVDVDDPETGATRQTPIGTAFFVQIPVEGNERLAFTYLVTARHVIDGSRKYGKLFARMNLKSGGSRRGIAPQDNWLAHATTDVAVATIAPASFGDPDLTSIPLEMLATDAMVAEHGIGEGDDVVLIGLFHPQPGTARSEPVLRFGHVSLMPYDPVPIKMDPHPDAAFVPVKAYLVEALAYGGQSGSPAFIYFAPDRKPGVIEIGGMTGGGYALLGLVHGHYPHKERVAITSGELTGQGQIDFNLGVSVVIPAQDILDLLNLDELVKDREDVSKQVQNANGTPTPDTGLDDDSEFGQFEDLTRKVVVNRSRD